MKINKTLPEETTQWQADAPSVKAMRLIMPIAALLSATSLAGGIASFFKLGLVSTAGICLTIFFAVAAWYFDGLAVSSGQSVVRDFILGKKKAIEMGTLFWINVCFATLISGAMAYGSFQMSRNGISYLVLEVRKAKEIRTQADTTLTTTIAGATDQNAGILEAKKSAYDAQVAAVTATYAGKIEALEAEIGRRQKQRSPDNRQYIDNQIARLKKQIGEAKAAQGKELAELATEFATEQSRILASREELQSLVVADAKAASERQKLQQAQKDEADLMLSGLVSSIFAWSVVLMLIIGLRLTMLETRNGILPNPILSNADLSGSAMLLRFVMAIPHFLFSCMAWISEWLYKVAPKHRTPIVDNDLVDFKAAQAKVVAIRKEPKGRQKKAAAEYREIGYKKFDPEPEKVGSEKLGTGAVEPEKLGTGKLGSEPKKLANKGSRFFSGPEPEKAGTQISQKVGAKDSQNQELIQQIKFSKRELIKYKKRAASSYQKIKAAERAGEAPKTQTLNAYENRKTKVEELTAEIAAMEAKLKSMS